MKIQKIQKYTLIMGLKFKCDHCGKEVDLNSDKANWYEDKKEFINDDGELEVWMKVQHHNPPNRGEHATCGMVTYLIFKGKLDRVEKRN